MATTENRIFTWRTTKEGTEFRFTVCELVARKTPNEKGQYCDAYIKATGLKPTRARAKSMAQRWVRYLKFEASKSK